MTFRFGGFFLHLDGCLGRYDLKLELRCRRRYVNRLAVGRANVFIFFFRTRVEKARDRQHCRYRKISAKSSRRDCGSIQLLCRRRDLVFLHRFLHLLMRVRRRLQRRFLSLFVPNRISRMVGSAHKQLKKPRRELLPCLHLSGSSL